MAELVDLIIPPELDKPVTLIVDASSSTDEAELEVVVKKSDNEEEVESSCVIANKDEESKNYTIEFTPPTPDKYTVTLKLADSEISGSPLKLNLSPPNAKNVALTRAPMGKIRTGQSIDILFDTFPGGRGELTGSCACETEGDIDVKVKRQGISTVYQVTFVPTHEDEYSLKVKYSEKSLKGSPFKIDLIPVNPEKVTCSKPVIPKDPSAPIGMDVCTEGAGTSQLRAKCVGEESGEVKVDIDKRSKNNYHLKFVPPHPDVFTLSILYGGKNVKDSPFIIDISSNPEKVKIGELHIPECAGTKEDAWVELDCSEAGRDEVQATCKGQNEEMSIPVSIEETGPERYRVKFTPKLPDIYFFTLFYGGKLIPDGSFEINILPKSDSKLVRHLGTFIPDNCKQPVVLKFDASEAGKGELRARANGVLQAGPVAADVKLINETTKEYEVSFIPDGADTYNVDVYWSDETIPGSPIYVKIVYPHEVLISDPLSDPKLLHPVRVNVDTQYAGPGKLTAYCSGKRTEDVDVEIIQNESDNTKYVVGFRPIKADFYYLKIFFDDIEVKHSPIEVDLQETEVIEVTLSDPDLRKGSESSIDITSPVSPISPAEIESTDQVTPTELEMTIGQPLTLSVDSVEGDCKLTAVASGKIVGEVPVTVTPNELKGSFNVAFDPSKPDLYTVDVKLSDVHVPGSPFIINYIEKKESPKPGKVPTHPITKPYLIQYVPEDSLDEIVAYAIHDDSCTRIVLKIRQKKNGKTLLAFYPEETGLHFLHIKQGAKEIHGSPFELEIVPSDPSACKVLDVPEKVYIGEEAVITIDASKAGAGDMHVIASVPAGGKGTVFSHTESGSGKFKIKFTPRVAGRHSLTVKWADVTIPGAPIPVNAEELTKEIKQARDAASRIGVSNGVSDHDVFSTKLDHSEGALFYVQTEKAGQGELTVNAKGPGNARVDVTRQSGAFYQCRVNPVVSGKYSLDILWNDIRIPGHPYRLDFTANKTYIINELDLESECFTVGRASQYHVDCSQEEGELKILANPSDCAEIEVSPLESCERIFSVKIIPQRVGNHELSLKFSGKHLVQSPYHVQFEAASRLDQDTESQENNRLLRLSGLDFPISLVDPVPEASSVPPISAKPEVKVTAFGPGLEGGIIGQEGNFTVKTDGVGAGKLEIGIHGAGGAFKTKLRRHPDHKRTVLARYDPINIGQYTIDILWMDEHIEGSPFEVDVKPQEVE